ncbi:MAG: hypothetical protein GY724_17450 [Actinomycetia bacterium]|nr:hypothetical protein [Actinomycetes bacterium]MCP4224689.1 hypothetical protein [Actinomycetes bacterium]MCP5031909.1 hypothetical protein [Actinomycetes bacterium]
MTPNSNPGATVPVPLLWRESVIQSFVEIPVTGAPFGAIELQRIEQDSKVAHSVVVHRAPGCLELYVEPSIDVDEAGFRSDPAFAHFDIVHFGWTEFSEIRCHVASGELDAAALFTDCTGADVVVRARNASSRRSKPLFTPAPPQPTPQNLRFLVLDEFRLLPTRSSEVSVVVDGVAVTPSPMLIPSTRFAPWLSARTGAELLLASLAPAHDELVLPLASPGQSDLGNGVVTEVAPTGLRSIEIGGEYGHFAARFDPALPNLNSQPPPPNTSGRITIESPLGEVAAGRWQLEVGDESTTLELVEVSQDWFPGLGQPLRLCLQQARKHRRRDQHWHYRATLTPNPDNTWTSTGSWI